MNAEQKQRAKDALTNWIADEMAALLQELIDAPEPEPVAHAVILPNGMTRIWFSDKDRGEQWRKEEGIKQELTPLYPAPPTPSVPDEQLQAAPMTRQVDNAAVDMAALLHDLIEQPTSVPVLTVECEPDYWSGGHYHEGTKPHIDPTAVWKLPIGTKLYTSPPAPSVPDTDLARDAERYRWLRNDGAGFDISVAEIDDDGHESWVHGYPPEELDAAIDAALAAEKGGAA